MDLFQETRLTPFPLEDGALAVLPQLPLPISNAEVLARLIAETDWRAESITLWGKRHPQPRLTAWHGEAAYTYSGLRLEPLPFTPLQLELKQAVEAACGHRFNSVLLNYYRNERDSMGMHSDDEIELGPEPVIASLSFGAPRSFVLRHKGTKQTLKLGLNDGTLLVMSGNTQKHWQHGINKSTRAIGPRVNLTFRYVF
ncbi:alpha-ketoglutarate-dependent dioxygenase AlkB [Massilia atriviolacea]|uniref:Alpha-ketoglutarate-dependent dioxygenase AlkB n=1 Tax=Massilia atriviolacea TaxID=2495579 RepID=A0A430HNW4_9BURK|nr:alpha-ketoglutarate-dependent dioxygenase AlkB [Massilia atriviolacea]RSZ59245.1 alpha-ketoglutarate-dependent dioxygenase AlkB [Massilia atriviolacea]